GEPAYIIRDMNKLPTTVCTFLALTMIVSGSALAADWPLPRGDARATGSTATELPADLAVRWEFSADEAVAAPPVVAAGRVYLADVAGTIYCLSSDTGTEHWKLTTDIGFIS